MSEIEKLTNLLQKKKRSEPIYQYHKDGALYIRDKQGKQIQVAESLTQWIYKMCRSDDHR